MSGHCNECGNTGCVCAANDPAWRTFKKRGDVARLEARVAELEGENATLRDALSDALWRMENFSPEDLRGVEEAEKVLQDALKKGGTE